MDEYTIIIVIYPDGEKAKIVAKQLVTDRLAASVQMFPINSIFRWKNEICEANEIVLAIRTKADMFNKISDYITENHPYELPEIIQIPITDSLPEYLQWITDCVNDTRYNH